MSPDASPGEVTKKTGVRRVNNLPVYIIGGLMGVFLLVMVLVAADRADQQNRPAGAKDEKAGNTSMFANEIAGNQKDGIIQAERAAPPTVPDLSQPQGPAIDVAEAVELVEDALKVVFRDTSPLIGDVEDHRTIFLARKDGSSSVAATIFLRVVEKVEQNLSEQGAVATDERDISREADGDLVPREGLSRTIRRNADDI
eukprot:gene15329-20312_t